MQLLVTDAPEARPGWREGLRRKAWHSAHRWFLPELAVTVFAGLIFAWRVGTPSPWRDEAATMVIAHRTVPQILQLTRTVDFVHLAYYLIAHEVMQLFPTATLDAAVTPVRMVSVLAAALTAGVLVRVGRQLDSTALGVTAGVIYGLCPFATRFAQEARPYALVTLAATISTYALLRATRRPWRRRRWVLYAATVVVAPVLNVLSLVLLTSHLIYVLVFTPAAVRRRWATAVAGALTVVSPFVAVAFSQRSQVDWLTRPDLANLRGFLTTEFHSWSVPLFVILVAGGVLQLRHRLRLNSSPSRRAFGLGLAWGLFPPLLLWVISQVDPLFDWRYMVFTLPGSALLLASLATFVRPYGALVVILSVAVAGSSMQLLYRDPKLGHSEDVRGTTAYLQAQARAGDAVLFVPWYMRILEQMYPERFTGLNDIAIGESPVGSATIFGIEKPAPEISAALTDHRRVWLVTGLAGMSETMSPGDDEKVELLLGDYRIAKHLTFDRFQVFLYIRSATQPAVTTPRITRPGVPF